MANTLLELEGDTSILLLESSDFDGLLLESSTGEQAGSLMLIGVGILLSLLRLFRW